MRILVHHRTQGRGAERQHLLALIDAFERAGHVVRVLSPPGVVLADDVGAPARSVARAERGLRAWWGWLSRRAPQPLFEAAELAYNLVALIRLARAIRAFRPDFIYERYAVHLGAGAWLARRTATPLIVEVNEACAMQGSNRPSRLPAVGLRIERAVLRSAHRVHVVSSPLRALLIGRGVDAGRVVVTPNAADPARYAGPTRAGAVRRALGFDGCVVIGFAGALARWDRLDLLLEALARLVPGRPGLRALVVGEGRTRAGLEAAAGARGLATRVAFVGWRSGDDFLDHLDAIDLAVLPHSNDFGSPMVLFEFMALGKPLVVPRLAPFEDVLDDEATCLMFAPLDVDALCRRIERLLDDPDLGARLAQAARARQRDAHTWSVRAGRIVDDVRCAVRR